MRSSRAAILAALQIQIALAAGAAAEEVEESAQWAASVSAYLYVLPEDSAYAQPTLALDRDWLHLEARYNYENLETGSAWVGYNLEFGDELWLELTPMLGGVFGATNGIAPGYEYTLGWWKLELYSEGELVFDTSETAGSFFYTWTDLSLSPLDWFRFGLSAQRTKVYETEFDTQRGFLVGLVLEQIEFGVWLFNPDASQPTVVVGMSAAF